MLTRHGLRVAVALLATLWAQGANAELDPWTPGHNAWSTSLATGVPFLVMGEVAAGVTEHGALGVLAGTTPIVSAFGVRPRAAAPISDDVRLLFSVPIVYYPRNASSREWWLTRPSLELDARLLGTWRLALGGGVVAAATHDTIFEDDDSGFGSAYGAAASRRAAGVWGTANLISSVGLSARSALIVDATLVLSDSGLAGRDWIGGPPFILFVGVSTAL